jgi:hypothetical protein
VARAARQGRLDDVSKFLTDLIFAACHEPGDQAVVSQLRQLRVTVERRHDGQGIRS